MTARDIWALSIQPPTVDEARPELANPEDMENALDDEDVY